MKYISLAIISYVLTLVNCLAQTNFSKTYNGRVGYSVQQTIDKGYILTGRTEGALSDVTLIKTNEFGDTLWTKQFGQSYRDIGYDVKQTTDSGYIIVGLNGTFDPFDEFWGNVFVIKTDTNGDTLWTKIWGGIDDADIGYSVQQTIDGGYIVAGLAEANFGGFGKAFLSKLNANGDTLWVKKYGTLSVAWSVQETFDKGFIFSGSIGNPSDIYMVKTDSIGDTLWSKTYYGGPLHDHGRSIQQTVDSGYIIAGQGSSFSSNSSFYLLKTDKNGDSLWTMLYDGSLPDYAMSVKQTADSGYIATGSTMSFGPGKHDLLLIKINTNGDSIWTKIYGALNTDDIGYDVQQVLDGGFIIVGSINNQGNIWLIKTDSLGIAPPFTGIAGLSFEKGTSIMVYPNPFTHTTTFEITQNSKNTSYTFKLYDLLGRQVEKFKVQSRKFKVDRGTLSEGMYIYKLYLDEGMIHTGKLLVE